MKTSSVIECPVCNKECFSYSENIDLWKCENCKFDLTGKEVIENVADLVNYIKEKSRLDARILKPANDKNLIRFEKSFGNQTSSRDILDYYKGAK